MKYHIRRSERAVSDEREIEAILARCRYAIIALAVDNEPYVVTLTYGYDPTDKTLYFHCAKEGQKIDFIRKNPEACLTIIDEFGDTRTCDHAYRSLVIRGSFELIGESEETDRAIRLMIGQIERHDPQKFTAKLVPGRKSYDNLQILKLRIREVTGKARE